MVIADVEDAVPAAGQNVGIHAEDVKRTGTGKERTGTAEAQRTVRRMELHLSFTTEHTAALAEHAAVGVKAVFQHEGHGVAVAQIFGTLEAEAGTAVVAVDHFKTVDRGIFQRVEVGVAQTGVNDTVEREIHSACGSGRHDGCNSDGDLFHCQSLPWRCVFIRGDWFLPRAVRLILSVEI